MKQHKANVVIYVGKELSGQHRDAIEGFIRAQEGVLDMRSNERTGQLMLVDYDPGVISAIGLLHGIQGQGVDARLIGM